MKIILTGASGFVGSSIINFFKDKPEIHILPLNLRIPLPADVFKGQDCVIHLAAKAHDLRKVSNPHDYYSVNTDLTKTLYDAFTKSDAKKFIFMSSVKAAADTVDGILTEDIIPNPKTDYGRSKLMAEEYIQKQMLPAGKSYYILRPCMIHGPGNKGNLNLLHKFVEKGVPYPLASFENNRSFLSIENLCFVINQLLEKNIPSGIYNVADDENLSTNQLVVEIAKTLNLKARLWKIPSAIIKNLVKIGDRLKLPLTTERLTKLTENYLVSNKKIKEALRIDLPVSAREGLRVTVQSFTK